MIITFDDLKKEAHDHQNGKVCNKCNEHKPLSEYYPVKRNKDGLAYECKSCHREYKDNKCPFKIRFGVKKKNVKVVSDIEFTIKPTDIPGVKIGETITIDRMGRKYTSWETTEYPKICPILEIELDWGKHGNQPNSPSFDRIDSTKGYIPGNVMIMSNLANKMKNNATPEQLVKFSKYMLSEYGG